jgi:hypothetical protein
MPSFGTACSAGTDQCDNGGNVLQSLWGSVPGRRLSDLAMATVIEIRCQCGIAFIGVFTASLAGAIVREPGPHEVGVSETRDQRSDLNS